jgi:hypothetical protein
MGQELRCTVGFGGRTVDGKAWLETDALIFRPDGAASARGESLRLNIPFKAMRSVEAVNGDLKITFPQGIAVFELGGQAQKWAQKILHPKSLLDKLGVKPGMKVSVLDVEDEGFLGDLSERTGGVAVGEPQVDSDMIFVGVAGPDSLDKLAELRAWIKPNGSIWAVFRKGQKEFNENDVLRGGLDAGLVDVKVVRFSDTHTACKFVIRKSER